MTQISSEQKLILQSWNFWKEEWEKQKGKAGEYNVAVEEFMALEKEENNDSKTRSQDWKEHFDVVVGKMEV